MGLIGEKEENRGHFESQEKHRRELAAQEVPASGCYTTAADAVRPATEEEIQNMKLCRVLNRLDYHAPNRTQIPRYQAIRDAAKAFVTVLVRNTPAFSDDAEAAIRTVEATVMMANKAIALEDTPKL